MSIMPVPNTDSEAQQPTLRPDRLYSANLDEAVGSLGAALHHRGPPVQQTAKWFAIIASGAAFITDGYQNSLLTTGNIVFPKIYGTQVYNTTVATRVSNALFVGLIIGMIMVGLISDRVGRKAGIFLTTGFTAVGGLLGTVAHAPTSPELFWFLTVARGIVGIGSGGEYPATAAASIEAANQISVQRRGFYFNLAVYTFNLLGGCLTYCVFLFVASVQGYHNGTSPAELHKLEITWRVEWAIGVVLPLTVFYFRMKLRNSALYERHAIKRDVPILLYLKGYWFRIIGVLNNYIFLQFIGTASSTFSGLVIASVLPTATLRTTVEWQLFGTALQIPAALLGAYMCDRIPKKVQITLGWLGYVVFGLVIGATYKRLHHTPALFFVLYALFLSVQAFGPSSLNGVVATETYPTAIRATAYGVTAAIGKVAAICGNYAFTPIKNHLGIQWVFYISAILASVAILGTWIFVVDRRGVPLSVIDDEFEAYLASQGFKRRSDEVQTERTVVLVETIDEK